MAFFLAAGGGSMKALAIPLRIGKGGSITTTTRYEEIVRGQVVDALMTNQGERVIRVLYGCDIQSALFDPKDELVRRDAASIVKERLQAFVPRSYVEEVWLTEGEQPSVVQIHVRYRVSQYESAQDLTVPLSSEYINRALQRGKEDDS